LRECKEFCGELIICYNGFTNAEIEIMEAAMSNPVIFKDLPATFPEEDKHKKPAALGSIAIHLVLVTVVGLIPLLMPQHIEHWRLLTMLAPAPPPPPSVVPIYLHKTAQAVAPAIQRVIKVAPDVLLTPTEIPKEISRIVDAPPQTDTGGIIGGAPGGVLHGVLLATLTPPEAAPPPPPPPPTAPPPPTPEPILAASRSCRRFTQSWPPKHA
jgi:hypothetical protein